MSELSSQPTPLQTIYNWYRNGALIVNRRYQRKLVWTLNEKQKLIDSILNSYPIPLVLLAAKSDQVGIFEILDGLQRLHTIVSFIENGFATSDDRYFDVNEFTRAKEERESGQFKETDGVTKITRSEVAKILDYVLPISIIRNASDTVITDVFGRINSYGHRLSEQERRQAGLVSDFAEFVRTAACELRGDVSVETLPLHQMPEISVDLPKSKYGYGVQAEDVFWVRQGILRSTDLRDSLDEQVVADIIACIVSDKLIERSKDALDDIYDSAQSENAEVNARLSFYGQDRTKRQIKYCIEMIDEIVKCGAEARSLRSLIFETRTTNPFPTVFASIFLAIHELSFRDNLLLANKADCHKRLKNISSHLKTGRDATAPEKRRDNINAIKGLIRDCFVTGDVSKIAYGQRRELDITNTLRRSQIETPRFEMKQGIFRLDDDRVEDENVFLKVLKTMCAIANIGPDSDGMIFIGVADKETDADRIKALDGVEPSQVGTRWIVGIDREASILRVSIEKYYQRWREKIDKSGLSHPLKTDVLSNIDMCLYEGRHILIISVPRQSEVSFFNNKVYVREADQTLEASPEKIVAISSRFRR